MSLLNNTFNLVFNWFIKSIKGLVKNELRGNGIWTASGDWPAMIIFPAINLVLCWSAYLHLAAPGYEVSWVDAGIASSEHASRSGSFPLKDGNSPMQGLSDRMSCPAQQA
jgi:hypothetical protein